MRLLFLMAAAIACSVPRNVEAEDRYDWSGLYAQMSAGTIAGRQSVDLATLGLQTDLYALSATGDAFGLSVGYVWSPLRTRYADLYFGVNASLHQLTFAGTQAVNATESNVMVQFASDRQYTLGAQVALARGKYFVYGEAGITALAATVGAAAGRGTVSYRETVNGYALGRYYAIGVRYALHERFSVGAQLSSHTYALTSSSVAQGVNVRRTARLSYEILAVTATFRFAKPGASVARRTRYTPVRAAQENSLVKMRW